MAVEKSYARLGLFLVVGLVVILATALIFIQRLRSREVIEMVTYTTDNVSGLDISSPVRYRGVPLGRVSGIRADPVGNTIEITFEVYRDRLATIGANVTLFETYAAEAVFPKMRAQVIGNPVTGEAYLLLDVPRNPPPPMALKFNPTKPYVASMPSPLSTVRDRLPEVLDRAEATLQTLREIVGRIPASLDRSDQFFTNVERIVRESQLPVLSAESRKFFATTSTQIEQLTTNLDRLVGTQGTLVKFVDDAHAAINASDLPATARSARGALEHTSLAADDLRRTLPAIRDSLDQLRQLARLLDEQPESVVYGQRPARVPPR
jgi:phospholipid/cholesterol/gamma-HCH transport system substrate-binding protein